MANSLSCSLRAYFPTLIFVESTALKSKSFMVGFQKALITIKRAKYRFLYPIRIVSFTLRSRYFFLKNHSNRLAVSWATCPLLPAKMLTPGGLAIREFITASMFTKIRFACTTQRLRLNGSQLTQSALLA